jgi:FixJ family two-component response regulator
MNAIEDVRLAVQKTLLPKWVSIVEDDAAVRDAITNLLESSGLRAEAFESAEDFMASASMDKKACLILDVGLPHMSGLDLQGRLHRDGYSIPIIFLTGDYDETVKTQAIQAGAVRFLYKPFNHQDLLDAVYSILR